MRSFVVFLCLTITWAGAQNGRGSQHQDQSGHGWDIRLAVPGEPGNDYPTLGAIPRTTFSCAGRDPGYYADLETNCQVFRVCTVGSTYGFQSFLCPNGTLFNQAVFVCDWWMNVDCQNSQQLINNNNEQFGNLKLGPQLMKDIKKMLTHPMQNPYDKNSMKSNLIVMQDYKPPLGQLFPNGALLAGPERAPNNVYVPSKIINPNIAPNNYNDFTFSASTPEPRYLSGQQNNNVLPSQNDKELSQKQRQYPQSNRILTTQNLQKGSLISNGHAGRLTQNTGLSNNNGFSQAPRPTQITNLSQNLAQNTQRREPNSQRAQYTDPRKSQRTVSGQRINTASLTNSQNIQRPNNHQNSQINVYNTPTPKPPQVPNHAAGKELKQNLVSTSKDVISTEATRATTYIGKLPQASKIEKSKSRITVKTWIVKPTKSARLINPTPYTYMKPTQPHMENLVEIPNAYFYERPTASSQTEKTVSTESVSESGESYVFTKPTALPKLVSATSKTTRLLISPTVSTTRSLLSGRLEISPSPPAQLSRVYLTPPTFASTSRFYLPPPQNLASLARQYLPANIVQPPVYYSSAQLRASTTAPSSTFVTFTLNTETPSFPAYNESRFNIDPNNLIFTDIQTKEKLDITVNDIVKDTKNILRTASPEQYNQYNNKFNSVDYIENDYTMLPTRPTTDSGEKLTSRSPSQSSTNSLKSARIIATPSPSLQPPKQTSIYKNVNQLSTLPFFKESSVPNTIERTVSIKITIPERIAAYLFKNRSESELDKLEILNTGSSNYLVLSNNLLTKDNGFKFIPIAKLNGNKSSNISNSQALVYSFLADSINVAREYNNIAQQEILLSTPSPTPQQFQNLNNEQLSQITNKISQLTSSQYSSNVINNANTLSSQTTSTVTNPFSQLREINTELNQPRQAPQAQYNIIPSQQKQDIYSSRSQTTSNRQNDLNSNQIYSGQLYQWAVPDVTDQIFNRQNSENLVMQQSAQLSNLPNNFKQSSPSFEVVKAEAIAFNPTQLQLESPSSPTPFSSQENIQNLLSSGNGISAQFQDKIVGTIPHPLEDDKVLRYKKDQSYLLYTKYDDNTIDQNVPTNTQSNIQQNIKSMESKAQDLVTYQLVPSISFELEDEKEQQEILNTFRIDEFGAPREIVNPNNMPDTNIERKEIDMVNVESAEENTSSKKMEEYRINALYDGQSSYSAPQSSVGSLEARQVAQNNNLNSRLEDLDENNSNGGYPKDRPARHFTF